MRFLVVGAWRWDFYERALAGALRELGHEVRGVGWSELFRLGASARPGPELGALWRRAQNRLIWGPIVTRFNEHLIQVVEEFRPDVLFGYSATHVLRSTLEKLRELHPRMVLVHYTNDNPFSPNADPLVWRHVKASIPIQDVNFVYRQANLGDMARHGGGNVQLLRSYFVPESDYRIDGIAPDDRLRSDVLFIGHYEPDGRVEALESVARRYPKFKLFGGTWERARRELGPRSPLRRFLPVQSLGREDYRIAISATRIALCFLSKLNADTYTRRNFEIPAMGAFMLSQYTDDLASLFKEGHDAEFFRSVDELLDKIEYYLAHEDKRLQIARSGHERLFRDGHDVVSRARSVVAAAQEAAAYRS